MKLLKFTQNIKYFVLQWHVSKREVVRGRDGGLMA
jgi:hypothetical protein